MMFFSIKAELSEKIELDNREQRRGYAMSTQPVNEEFYFKNRKNVYMFIESVDGFELNAAAFIKSGYLASHTVEKLAEEFFHELKITCSSLRINEITWSTAHSMLRGGYRNDYIKDDDETLSMLKLSALDDISFSEGLLYDIPKLELLRDEADKLLCTDTLGPELTRIFHRPISLVSGHPVHYLIQADDSDVRTRVIEVLIAALYANGRVGSKRWCNVVYEKNDYVPEQNLRCLYDSCRGGVMVIEYSCEIDTESEHAKPGVEAITRLCDMAKRYQNEVLTIVCLPRAAERVKSSFLEHLGSITLVPLCEDIVHGDRAKKYLRRMALNAGAKPDRTLYKIVTDPQHGYLATDLQKEFNRWFSRRLKTTYYPQYAALEDADKIASLRGPRGSAYAELKRMVGLTEAKAVVGQALDYYKAQKLFRDRGMRRDNTAMHMVFTGITGSAKTTVARRVAQFMKEYGLLSVGDLVEVGRADLVGKYVGWTAPTVRNCFEAAKGSVLFIDEAYSLVDDKAGLYGDEAINTIVQEMENRREDMVVIFAGYPDKMDEFLQTNPGLRSRIAFHVPFSDYDSEELWSILELMADRKNLLLEADVKEKLLPVFSFASADSNFGNGRYVRNLFEKALLRQASRLVAIDPDTVTDMDIRTLCAADFEITVQPRACRAKIGFCA
jgi:AAA+ superfamily predicted ATPase